MSFSKFFNEIPSHFSVLFRNFIVVQFSKINRTGRKLVLNRMCSIILSHLFSIVNPFSKLFLNFLNFLFSFKAYSY